MTDSPTSDPDELASAHLDDALDATERDRLTPEVLARAEELQAVRDLVAAPVEPPTAADRERLVANALAAFDGTAVPDDGEQRDADPALDLATRRARKAPKRIWLPPPAVAAAVVVVLALAGIGLIVAGNRSSSRSDLAATLSSATSTTPRASDAADGAESATTPAPDREVADLGAFADQATLTAALKAVPAATLDGTDQTSPTTLASTSTVPASDPPDTGATSPAAGQAGNRLAVNGASVDRCDTVVRSTDPSLGTVLAVAAATVDGRPVLVFSHPVTTSSASDPSTRITVTDRESCLVLFGIQR